MGNKQPIRFLHVPISQRLWEIIDQVVSGGTYRTKADFVREAVRVRLQAVGYDIDSKQEA